MTTLEAHTDSTTAQAEMPAGAIPLCELRDGEVATVCQIRYCPERDRLVPCCQEDFDLLRAMGLGERCRLRVCRGGKRCIVQVDSTRLGICNTIARHIMVSRHLHHS